jgi:hypothetical protein|tara:strand:+ start:132 stop:419 length:288 start_codon:yes stop_codon:yes gene_type:complete
VAVEQDHLHLVIVQDKQVDQVVVDQDLAVVQDQETILLLQTLQHLLKVIMVDLTQLLYQAYNKVVEVVAAEETLAETVDQVMVVTVVTELNFQLV